MDDYDVVLCSAFAFAKGVITPSETLHICYCHTPARFVWRFQQYIERERLGKSLQILLSPLIHYPRGWHYAAAQRVDFFISNSCATERRIQKKYRRDSTVIQPPVDVERFSSTAEIGNYYLIVSRLAPYKRIDLAIQEFNQLYLPLTIVGAGVDEPRVRKMAGPEIEFLGHVPEDQLTRLYARCRAVVFPGVEDFGIVPLEANASGRPVIAYAADGALETVIEGTTGAFFRDPTPEALVQVVAETDVAAFDLTSMCRHAEQFSKERLKERIAEFVQGKWNEWDRKSA